VKNDGADTLDPENGWTAWKLIDHGDFVGVEGYLFVTNTGEVSLHVEKLQFLAKAMLPMPDKMHGIADPEIRQRQRYADLIASSLQVEHDGLTTREVFETRAKVISSLRRYLEDHGYIEVETPMLTPKATGAAAKPFVTHHNALDITLYARIAPELYLKRRVRKGLRAEPQLPQRGDLVQAQPRVHDAGVLLRVHGRRGDDGFLRGDDARERTACNGRVDGRVRRECDRFRPFRTDIDA